MWLSLSNAPNAHTSLLVPQISCTQLHAHLNLYIQVDASPSHSMWQQPYGGMWQRQASTLAWRNAYVADNTWVCTIQFQLIFVLVLHKSIGLTRQLPRPVRPVSPSAVFLAALERFKVSDFAANSFASSAVIGPAALHECEALKLLNAMWQLESWCCQLSCHTALECLAAAAAKVFAGVTPRQCTSMSLCVYVFPRIKWLASCWLDVEGGGEECLCRWSLAKLFISWKY